ncbi:MAG: hypothetical protein PF630_06015 [Gammaproteobacteria bacterium]|nr:hypothetical protein [Gammaproteobacteria bacterium]
MLLGLAAAGIAWAVTLDQAQNTAVQARVYEAEATATTAMQAVAAHCQDQHAAVIEIDPYEHVDAPDSYIASLDIRGTCAQPAIHIAMRNTLALPVEPVFAFTGQWSGDMLLWGCRETAGTGQAFIPDSCR